jgi:hypothetical protein
MKTVRHVHFARLIMFHLLANLVGCAHLENGQQLEQERLSLEVLSNQVVSAHHQFDDCGTIRIIFDSGEMIVFGADPYILPSGSRRKVAAFRGRDSKIALRSRLILELENRHPGIEFTRFILDTSRKYRTRDFYTCSAMAYLIQRLEKLDRDDFPALP